MKKNFILISFFSFLFFSNVSAEKSIVFDFTEKEFKTLKIGKKYKRRGWACYLELDQ